MVLCTDCDISCWPSLPYRVTQLVVSRNLNLNNLRYFTMISKFLRLLELILCFLLAAFLFLSFTFLLLPVSFLLAIILTILMTWGFLFLIWIVLLKPLERPLIRNTFFLLGKILKKLTIIQIFFLLLLAFLLPWNISLRKKLLGIRTK